MEDMTKYKKFLNTPSGKIISLTTALFVALILYYFYAISQGTAITTNPTETVTVSLEDHTRGGKAAKVTIVEYGDFQCSACRAYESLVKEILAKYPEDVRVTFREFPLINVHKNAFMSATYAEAAGVQGKFWEMHDILYDKQEEWGETLDAETRIQGYAKEIGLDVEALKKAVSSDAIQQKVVASYKEAMGLKLQGTPSFFVNGTLIKSSDLQTEIGKVLGTPATTTQK